MAGNLVKWWKHKILGGYKQFSVQECTTDSEELMYHQVRASSSCSAPPDLLLVSDRENNMPLRSPVVNIIATNTTAPATTTTSPSSGINACHITSAANNNQHRYQQHQQQQQQKLQHHHHQQQQQQQHHQHQVTTQQLSLAYNNGCKDIIGNTGGGINAAGGSSGGGGKHQKQSVVVGNSSTSKHGHQQQQQTPDMQPSSVTHDVVDGQPLEVQTNNHSSTKQTHHHTQQQQHHNHNHNTHHQQPQRSEEHIRLEEFTCDVSVEGGKSSQPLQFSFTFYDLDGHHGKITKDDIVGIVYTIYESIGKSVVVPHSGSKTINVRLTVSPEGKAKATKNNKKALDHHSLNLNQKPTAAAAALASSNNTQATRRLHRYRPRKLIKSDEEDDDSNSDKERDLNLSHILAHKAASKAHKLGKLKTSEQHCCSQQQTAHQQHQQPALNDLPNSPLETAAIYDNLKASSPLEACRECLAAAATADDTRNQAATSPLVTAATTTTTTISPAQFSAASSKTTNEAYMKHVASTRIKMLRKSRKQKHQDCLETRQRSLSVGNETCWKNRHLQTKYSNNTQQQLLWQAEQHFNNSVVTGGGNSNGNGNGSDMVDGVQLRNPLKNTKSMMASSSSSAHKRNSAECWKTALNRNDLISIIRESMEKNRLCFQLNGKPQANVSPIRQQTNTNSNTNNPHQQTQPHNPQVASNSSSKHTQQHQTAPIAGSQQQQQQRQRSNTVSKIPTLIANHNNTQSTAISPQHHHHPQRSSSCANTISNNCNNHSHSHDTSLANEPYSHTNSSNSSNNHHYHHHQPHIPIYHQQMAINPAVIAAQNALLTATASGNVGSSLLQQHGKMNLCGYDSFLHATICGGGLSHSPPPPPAPTATLPALTSTNHNPLNTPITASSNANLSHHQHQQQIATVQPIMQQNASSTSKHLSLAVTPQQQLKSSKILRQTSNTTPSQSQHQHHSFTNTNTTQNSPQYHGYQRLPSSSKHNLSALHLLSPNTEKPSLSELDKWRRDQVKSYDQLLYAKLSEKLQQTNLVASSSNARVDCNQRRKQRVTRQRRATALQQEDQAINNDSLPSTEISNGICLRRESSTGDYNSVIPIVGDPVECENLLGQTSDEDINSPQDVNPLQLKGASENRQVAEATLVDIDKITDELTAQKANLSLNVDTLLSVDDRDEVHNLHSLHEDDLEIDEDLEEEEEELDEELEDLGQIVESGRNSNNSNNSSNANSANTNTATNNGANNSTTSSLIHRYVHEHIHHHYHHFEEKEE